jgi:hypothetical protein
MVPFWVALAKMGRGSGVHKEFDRPAILASRGDTT